MSKIRLSFTTKNVYLYIYHADNAGIEYDYPTFLSVLTPTDDYFQNIREFTLEYNDVLIHQQPIKITNFQNSDIFSEFCDFVEKIFENNNFTNATFNFIECIVPKKMQEICSLMSLMTNLQHVSILIPFIIIPPHIDPLFDMSILSESKSLTELSISTASYVGICDNFHHTLKKQNSIRIINLDISNFFFSDRILDIISLHEIEEIYLSLSMPDRSDMFDFDFDEYLLAEFFKKFLDVISNNLRAISIIIKFESKEYVSIFFDKYDVYNTIEKKLESVCNNNNYQMTKIHSLDICVKENDVSEPISILSESAIKFVRDIRDRNYDTIKNARKV